MFEEVWKCCRDSGTLASADRGTEARTVVGQRAAVTDKTEQEQELQPLKGKWGLYVKVCCCSHFSPALFFHSKRIQSLLIQIGTLDVFFNTKSHSSHKYIKLLVCSKC